MCISLSNTNVSIATPAKNQINPAKEAIQTYSNYSQASDFIERTPDLHNEYLETH